MLDQITLENWTAGGNVMTTEFAIHPQSHGQFSDGATASEKPVYAVDGDTHYRLWFALPALDPGSLKLEAHGTIVTIRGQAFRPSLAEGETIAFGWSAGTKGWWSLRLPFQVSHGEVEATYHHGMLELKIEKPASGQRAVPIPLKAA